jgi:hypothetical protein
MKFTKRGSFKKNYGGGGGGPTTTTSESIPSWARPYFENVGRASESAYASGALGRVAGPSENQKNAFGMGSTIRDVGTSGLTSLSDQQNRLTDMAKTGGANELKDALALDVGMSNADISNKFGASGTLGSARQLLASKTSEDAAKAKFAQQVITNKSAAEQALGSSIGQGVSTAGTTTSNLANIGNQERGIAQQEADSAWQALQRYSSSIYGNPARQQAVQSGGGGK